VAGSVQAKAAENAADVLWELLRFNDGSFEFLVGEEPQEARFSAVVSEAVEQARGMLEEWDRIVERVPGSGHQVCLTDQLPDEDVRLSGEDWFVVVASGPSPKVSEVLDSLDLAEFEGCRRLAELVDRGLLNIVETESLSRPLDETIPPELRSDPPAGDVHHSEDQDRPLSEQYPEPSTEPLPHAELSAEMEARTAGELQDQPDEEPQHQDAAAPWPDSPEVAADAEPTVFPDHFPIDDLVHPERASDWKKFVATRVSDSHTSLDSQAEVGHAVEDETDVPAADPFSTTLDASGAQVAEIPTTEAPDDVLAQIGRLSPKAAEAIATALGDGSDDHR
jgi:hypothetical protein